MGGAAGDWRRQGIDLVTAVLSNQLRLTGDQLRLAAVCIGADDLPAGVAPPPRHPTIGLREAAFEQAARELLAHNLILKGGVVHPDLAPVLQALQRPDRELAIRLVTPAGIARISAVRRNTLCVITRRIGDDINLRVIGHNIDVADVVAALLAELPPARPGDIEPVAAPLPQMVQSLSGRQDVVELADRMRALGADRHAATLLSSALVSRRAFAEIVYSALAQTQGRICRAPAAVALFYTKRGRIVGVPSASPTGQLWTTLRPGSEHAVAQAINGLIDLTDHRWGPS